MSAGARLAALVAALALAACSQPPGPCRIGYDIGSSGIRVGSAAGDLDGRVSIDYLTDVWADGVIDQTGDATVEALRRLAGGRSCLAVAGGYSAWRLAADQGGPDRLADTLAGLHARTGVAVFVMPQAVEAGYGYYAARQQLGGRLDTPYILDIGGGSMQFAAATGGWGTALGQKAWRKMFCAQVKGSVEAECAANPVGADAVARTHAILGGVVDEARQALGSGFAVTAVSAPVVRGIHPVLLGLAARSPELAGHVDSDGFDRIALQRAVAGLAGLTDPAIVARLDGCAGREGPPECALRFVGSVVTDMLMVEAFMAGLDIPRMRVAQVELTNVAGILADSRAAAWAGRYACYLDRLRRQGIDAYLSDPAGCSP